MPVETVQPTEVDFDELVQGARLPVLVDFWAPWCGPCVAVAPILDELAEELEGELLVVKVNIDEQPELAQRFAISSIPAFVLFQQGAVIDRMLGAMPKAVFRQFLSRHL
jgi:thioredoxin